jgi:hypothetical protein
LRAIDEGLAQATDVARALVGGAVELSRVFGGGRNSRIWRVRSSAGVFALKQYPPRRDDPRDRLSTEVGALRLMEDHRVDTVPRVVGVDDQHGYALLSWIDGGRSSISATTTSMPLSNFSARSIACVRLHAPPRSRWRRKHASPAERFCARSRSV